MPNKMICSNSLEKCVIAFINGDSVLYTGLKVMAWQNIVSSLKKEMKGKIKPTKQYLHHIDGDIGNNNPENLQIINTSKP